MNARAVVKVRRAQIRGDDAGGVAVLLDELGRFGAATQRLDAQAARASKEIQDARPGQRRGQVAVFVGLEATLVCQRLEHRKDGALDQVSGRPCLAGGAQVVPASATRYDAHASARIARLGGEVEQVRAEGRVLSLGELRILAQHGAGR